MNTAAVADQLHLHADVLEVDRQRNERIAVLLLQVVELADLALVHQQALRPVGVAVEDVAVVIRGDVQTVGVDFAILGNAEAVLQVQRPGADGLDFRTKQLDARLIAVLDKIVVVRLAVLRRDFDAALFHGGPPLLLGFNLVYHTFSVRARGGNVHKLPVD